jgi:hypothetical protein
VTAILCKGFVENSTFLFVKISPPAQNLGSLRPLPSPYCHRETSTRVSQSSLRFLPKKRKCVMHFLCYLSLTKFVLNIRLKNPLSRRHRLSETLEEQGTVRILQWSCTSWVTHCGSLRCPSLAVPPTSSQPVACSLVITPGPVAMNNTEAELSSGNPTATYEFHKIELGVRLWVLN